jgi:cytochrome c biogenesis protein CcmG, thiol:disulfide interchange protein DsbE
VTGRQQLGVVATLVIVVAVAIAAGRHFLKDELMPLGAGTRAPEFRAMTLDTPARAKTMADYKGQVVLLNVWATWCQPCRAEMPSMDSLNRAFAPKGLKVVAVSIDDAGSERGISAFVQELGLSFEILHDVGGSIQQVYQTTGVPESVLIGRDGIIRKKIAGAINWNSDDNRALVGHLLAE